MKEVIINDNSLTMDDIEKEVIRVKAFIINSKGKILIAHNNNTYQFPGGHTEGNETLEDCLVREIREEIGIDVEHLEEPFFRVVTFDNDYFGTGKKVLNSIYYYRIITDQEPDLSKTHYDELELATDFNLYYVNFKNLDAFLNKEIALGNIDPKIGKEMLLAFEEYKNKYGGIL
ncbi:MAG: NUDIX hydrolase [Bacilli bacterium]|nr:NUDIX hydrolase [Bacilli bacterium]